MILPLVLSATVATSSAAEDRLLTDLELELMARLERSWRDEDRARDEAQRCARKLAIAVEAATSPAEPEERLPSWVAPTLGCVGGFAVGAPVVRDEPAVVVATTGAGCLIGVVVEVLR